MRSLFLIFLCLLVHNDLSAFSSQSEQGLKIIGELPPDNSLLKKIQELPDEQKLKLAPEYYRLLEQLRIRIDARSNGGPIEPEILHEELSPEEALEIFGPCIYSQSNISQTRTVIFQCFSPQFYFVKRSEKAKVEPCEYFTIDELDEIFRTAKKILNATSPGDIFISLGQSPAYIVEALEELISDQETEENFRVIYKIPFSGAPDYCCNNFHYKGYKLSNITTPASLNYFKEMVLQKGFNPLLIKSRNRVYIIDLIGTGGSLTSFLKIILNWYKALGTSMPDFKILDISVENRNFKNIARAALPVSESCTIYIERLFVHTTPGLSDKLDYTEGEDRVQPPFEALQWKPEYRPVFDQYPNEYARQVIHWIKRYVSDNNNLSE